MITVVTATGKRATSSTIKVALKIGTIQPVTIKCDSCAMVVINGTPCHETGCPESWRDETPECGWCGAKFVPAFKLQEFCCDDCSASYHS